MGQDDADRPVRRARAVALLALVPAPATTAVMPAIGLGRETDPSRAILAAIGIAAVVITQSLALYRSVSGRPDHDLFGSGRGPRWTDLAFGLAVIASIPLVAPLALDRWSTWAWLGGSVAGSLPLLYRRAGVLIAGWVALLVVVLVDRHPGERAAGLRPRRGLDRRDGRVHVRPADHPVAGGR